MKLRSQELRTHNHQGNALRLGRVSTLSERRCSGTPRVPCTVEQDTEHAFGYNEVQRLEDAELLLHKIVANPTLSELIEACGALKRAGQKLSGKM